MTLSSTTAEDKAALRRQVRLTLAGLSHEALRRSDDALFAAFAALPQAGSASTLFAFWGIPGREPETARLVEALTARGKRVGLPRMLPGHLTAHPEAQVLFFLVNSGWHGAPPRPGRGRIEFESISGRSRRRSRRHGR